MSQVNPSVEDIKDKSNLLNDSQEIADVVSKASDTQIKTEVTSIAAEELRTGVQQQMPTAEELVARANSSFIRNLQALNALINRRSGKDYAISRKGMNRLLISIIQLPQDGLPVNLNSQEEKLGFGIGQRCVSDRFILTQHHIGEEMKRIKAEREEQVKLAEANKNSTVVDNKGDKNE